MASSSRQVYHENQDPRFVRGSKAATMQRAAPSRTALGEISVNAMPQQQPPPGFGMRKAPTTQSHKAKTFSVYRDIPGPSGLHATENVPPAAQSTRGAFSSARAPSASRAPSVPSFAIYSDENNAPAVAANSAIQQNAVERSAFWAEKSAKPNFVIHTDEEIETTTTTTSATSSASAAAACAAAAPPPSLSAARERVPLGTLPMPKPVIKDDAEEGGDDDEFGPVEMAEASSTSVNMSEDSDDDDYAELEGVELYKGGSSVADDHEAMEDAAEAAVTPNLGSAVVCPHREVSHDMAALLDFAEYQDDVIEYLRSVDTKHTPKYQYMIKQPDITYPMRAILVDWLVEVGEEYKLQPETIYLAVNYIDRFLSYMSVQRAKLQLVGTACMFIAAKYEEIYPPEVTEFVYITDDTYTKKQVLRMEHLVLKVLNFDLAIPSALTFANLFCKMSESEEKATHLAQYLCELTLMDGETYLNVRPSVIGAACCALSRHNTGAAAWPSWMSERTGVDVEEFRECIIALNETFRKAETLPQQAIREKYKSEKYSRVSTITPQPIY